MFKARAWMNYSLGEAERYLSGSELAMYRRIWQWSAPRIGDYDAMARMYAHNPEHYRRRQERVTMAVMAYRAEERALAAMRAMWDEDRDAHR
jgi:hypothetical protein